MSQDEKLDRIINELQLMKYQVQLMRENHLNMLRVQKVIQVTDDGLKILRIHRINYEPNGIILEVD